MMDPLVKNSLRQLIFALGLVICSAVGTFLLLKLLAAVEACNG